MLQAPDDTLGFENVCVEQFLIETLTVILGPRTIEVGSTATNILSSVEFCVLEVENTHRASA